MKNMNAKGQGKTQSMQLNAEQKVALTLWIHQNKEVCEKNSSFDIAQLFKQETGISVSSSSIITTRNAVFPEMKRARKQPFRQDFDAVLFIQKMNQLNNRISRIESELGILPL